MGSSGGVVAGDWRVESDEAALRVGRLECGHLLRSELGRKPRKRERKRKQKYPIFGGKIGMLHEGGECGGCDGFRQWRCCRRWWRWLDAEVGEARFQ